MTKKQRKSVSEALKIFIMGLTTWAYAPEGMMLSTIGILR